MTLVGRQLDEYRLERLLGQGGMAHVYLAMDVRLKRYVAIKVMDAPFHGDKEYEKRFEREAQAAARLEHPRIVRLYRFGEVDGLLYMAMQYIEGSDLAKLLAIHRQAGDYLKPKDAARLIREICTALDYAHSQGVIHRDIKPSNILLDKQKNAFLADFGLARLRGVGTQGKTFGSPHYIAPEQAISSAKAVPQSDLYAVGVILYEIFTGTLPFDAGNPTDIAMKHISESPRPPRKVRSRLNPELEQVILTALAKEPEKRYQSGAELSDALEQALEATRVRKPARRSATPTASATLPKPVVPPLPPVPAAVAPEHTTISVPSPLPEESEPLVAASSPRRLRWKWIGFSLALIGLLVAAGIFWQTQRNSRESGQDTRPDLDHDGIVDAEDRCPEVAGATDAYGCLYIGVVIANTNVNMREGPSLSFKVLGIVHPGSKVIILGRNAASTWYWVRVVKDKPENDINAWIAHDLVQTTTPMNVLPPSDPLPTLP